MAQSFSTINTSSKQYSAHRFTSIISACSDKGTDDNDHIYTISARDVGHSAQSGNSNNEIERRWDAKAGHVR